MRGAAPSHRPTRPATLADEQALYQAAPSFADMLPWVEYLPESGCMLLDDGRSVAAFFELLPVGTEGREAVWLTQTRDALENALQDSFDELDEHPWVVQLYAQDDASFADYLDTLQGYIQPRARDTAFSEHYLSFFARHVQAIAKPGGLFQDNAVTRLPWRGQTRRVRMVVYRRVPGGQAARRGQSPEHALAITCERLIGGLTNAGVQALRMNEAQIHTWLLRWFNPQPSLLGDGAEDRERFYRLAGAVGGAVSESVDSSALEAEPDLELSDTVGLPDALPLADGTDFSQRLFFGQPRSDTGNGCWYFDGLPHRVMSVDRLRSPPATGQLTGETRKGDAINTLFDQMPEDTILCLTLVATPQDVLEAHLNHLARKSVGETLASEQTRKDVQLARSLIGSAHKLYRGSLVFYLRGRDIEDIDHRGLQLANVMLNAGLQPVREEDEVAPLNSYLRWLPCVFDPAKDSRQWYTQLMFAQHAANLAPVWTTTALAPIGCPLRSIIILTSFIQAPDSRMH